MKNVGYFMLRNKVLSPYLNWKEKRRPDTGHLKPFLPDFIGIGGHKCGSTWLYENMGHHASVFLSQTKELHYFDLHFHKSLSWYAGHFKKARPEQLKGEITPAYGILSPARIAYIHDLVPEAKVLFLIRNPVERAWSHALMAFITRNGMQPEHITHAQFSEHFKRYHSTARTHYETIYKNWAHIYGRENIWVGFYQEIEKDPVALLTSCFRFLGLALPTSWNDFPLQTKFNKGPELEIPPDLRSELQEQYRPFANDWRELFGERINEWGL